MPDKMVQAVAAFLDFCYLVRRSSHTLDTLAEMDDTLHRFHSLRTVFEELGVRPDGFSLPRQHSLVHYVRSIILFGSPNGLCSSITESRHITAVKRPWRRSSKNKPLLQILRTNTRLSKLAALRVDFGRRSMLYGDVLTAAKVSAGLEPEDDLFLPPSRNACASDAADADWVDDENDVASYEAEPKLSSFFELAKKPGTLALQLLIYISFKRQLLL